MQLSLASIQKQASETNRNRSRCGSIWDVRPLGLPATINQTTAAKYRATGRGGWQLECRFRQVFGSLSDHRM